MPGACSQAFFLDKEIEKTIIFVVLSLARKCLQSLLGNPDNY